ncbi:hypothetical protein CANARDRAFT_30232 [[Candida] arabinofermentans NRRL YB-2248]|uniref:Uncharacterized protein n=1 Tax=[Candida] arabinofermentans NRRL YB-2248 TaxID=983967 RepID=A0A1E4SUF6_9ASCO|nr:hypothetical protein CANARDRAFT_30232 [[Candida] arabinofermentans NRRL YB-2248]
MNDVLAEEEESILVHFVCSGDENKYELFNAQRSLKFEFLLVLFRVVLRWFFKLF